MKTQRSVIWEDGHYVIDGKPQFLVSGECHYFRIPVAEWATRLGMLKEIGANCVATYFPWIIHEPVEGNICFHEDPQTNIEAFLDLCNEMGLLVLVRPGPYQYSELRYGGLPGWLIEKHPEILARDIDGKTPNGDGVSYLHPVFLEKAERWIRAASSLLSKHMTSKGGPVALVQVDNEMMGPHDWVGTWDYHPESMGIGDPEGRYTRYLMTKYPNLAQLNTAYGISALDYAEVKPVDRANPKTVGERRNAKDYQEFYFGTVAEYASKIMAWMRESGIDCKIVHNSASPYMNAWFHETVDRMGKDFLLGVDHYYNLDMDWEQNNPTPKYASKVFYSLEQLRLMGFPPTVFELPGGSFSDWPPMLPQDLECAYMTNLAFGMKGLNYYIFTGGINPKDAGSTGDIYDFNAAISWDGKRRPHFYVQQRIGKFLSENAWMATAGKVSDFYLGYARDHARNKGYFAKSNDFSNGDAWSFFRKGIMISALCGSYSPALIDLHCSDLVQYTDKPLFVAASVCMSRAVQLDLIAFVEAGGQLFLGPVIPSMDEDFRPCRILQNYLDGASATQLAPGQKSLSIGAIHNIYTPYQVYGAETIPGFARAIGHEDFTGQVIAWKKQIIGGGCIIWSGLPWRHQMHCHHQMMAYLLGELDRPQPAVRCSNTNVWTSLQTDGERSMLFAMNLFSSPVTMSARVNLGNCAGFETGEVTLAPMEVRAFPIHRWPKES